MTKWYQPIVETARGGFASLRWLVGVPFVNARISMTCQNKQDARQLIAIHFSKFLNTCQFEISIEGTPPKQGQGCILCYNETSFADVAAYSATMWPYIDRAAAADIYAYFPFGRSSLRKADVEMVPRGNRLGTERLLTVMVSAVKNGERVAWGGEGRLVGHDGVGRFKIGAGLIAIRAQVPVVPVVFHGGHRAMPLGSVRARPSTIRIYFGEPIETTGLLETEAREFVDNIQQRVADIYEEMSKK